MLFGTITVAVVLLLSCDTALSRTETVNKAAVSALYSLAESCTYYNCPNGWPKRSTGQDSCYYYSGAGKASWPDAMQHCKNLGGHLVEFDSEAELAIARGLLQSYYKDDTIPWLWTGLNDRGDEGVYRWAGFGGQLGAESAMWDANQPDDYHFWLWTEGEDCVLFNGIKLNDKECNDEFTYMCEYKPSTPV